MYANICSLNSWQDITINLFFSFDCSIAEVGRKDYCIVGKVGRYDYGRRGASLFI